MSHPEKGGAGSAPAQSELWGGRARDWADVQEPIARPLYEAVLNKANVGRGTSVLDVGCGAGRFCQLAAGKGAAVTGFDATPALIAIAKERMPAGDFCVGDMETLPYADDSFDVVTGFNSFQYAANPVNALKEARRVAKKGSPVFIATWGKPEDCQAAAYLAALGKLLSPPPPGAPGPFALSAEGALEALAKRAGLAPKEVESVDMPFEYPDLATALRGLLSAGPAVKAIEIWGEDRVREAVFELLETFRQPSGGFVMNNKFIYLAALAQ